MPNMKHILFCTWNLVFWLNLQYLLYQAILIIQLNYFAANLNNHYNFAVIAVNPDSLLLPLPHLPLSLSILFPMQVTPAVRLCSHSPPPFQRRPLHQACPSAYPLSSSAFTSACVAALRSLAAMSLPVNSDYLPLERIARYRHACSSGSPCATNKPIDIKPRARRG